MLIRSRHPQFAIDESHLTGAIAGARSRGRLTEIIFRDLSPRSLSNELSK